MGTKKYLRRRKKISNSLNIVGTKIRYYRELNNLSCQKLSDKLMLYGVDIHRQAICNIENGSRTVVDYELCAFAKCFKITVNDLVDDYFKDL